MIYSDIFCSLVDGKSCHGATVQNGTNQTIVDDNNDTWMIHTDDKIHKNGQPADVSDAVILLVYWNKTVYQQNNNASWWEWVDDQTKWKNAQDPRSSSNLTTVAGCMLAPISGSCGNPFNRNVSNSVNGKSMETQPLFERGLFFDFFPHQVADSLQKTLLIKKKYSFSLELLSSRLFSRYI
jgi:hypothetical protein